MYTSGVCKKKNNEISIKSLIKDYCYFLSFPFLLSGGFYSDDIGFVGTSCKKSPNGSFVALDEPPGTQSSDCRPCPLGDNCHSNLMIITYIFINYIAF